MQVNDILSEELRQQGFTLTEPDDHILELRLHGELIARFSQTGVEVDNILREARLLNDN